MNGKRQLRQSMRIFSNVCYVLEKYGMSLEDRHRIFLECKTTADKIKKKGKSQLLPQELFSERVVKENPIWFKDVKLNSLFLVVKPKK